MSSPRIQSTDLVFQALADKRYDWRTVHGISKATGLSYEEIEKVLLDPALDKVVMQSASVDRLGRALYTTRRRYKARSTIISRMRDALQGASLEWKPIAATFIWGFFGGFVQIWILWRDRVELPPKERTERDRLLVDSSFALPSSKRLSRSCV